jgi:hypothetical protein
MQKECANIVTEDLKRIPFSSYNIIYREARNENEFFANSLTTQKKGWQETTLLPTL